MKRWYISLLVFALTAALFFVSQVRANVCSDDGQELFAISYVTNAHTEQWNGADNYSEEICYYDYFQDPYNTEADPTPHACRNNPLPNKVLGLSQSTNAHVEDPDGNVYTSNVCYGDLSCFLQTAGLDCNDPPLGSNEYSLIVSIDGITNTHSSLTNVSARSLCCKSGIPPICDYDGICEPGQGETPQNCPDCVSVCGDGNITGIEQCDCGPNPPGWNCFDGNGDDLDGRTCADLPGYIGGTLNCNLPGSSNQCQFDESGCLKAECADRRDNDNDGAMDSADFSCLDEDGVYVPNDNNETLPRPQCNDFKDNDTDGKIDYPNDTGCDSKQDNLEANCGDDTVNMGAEECDGGDWNGINDCRDLDYQSGDLSCVNSTCLFNRSLCVGFQGFCIDNEPFEFPQGEILVAPSSCDDYNRVYPGEENTSMRRELCVNDCVPGASDPANNGYGGSALYSWGCGWDETNDRCYFWFSATSNETERCRLDYQILQDCGPDNPFRKVLVTSTPDPPGSTGWACEACGNGQPSCETEIICPRVIQLPFIGAFGLALAVVIIALIYVYLKRKK